MLVVDPAANVRTDGSRRNREYVCEHCGYGVCCDPPPERCPICRRARWRAMQTRRGRES